uniref:Glycoside hydrolase family 28 n=1 Tax=Aretaon asperrimus TaxID=173775 RepID=A0A191XSX2_9NEOP|nr:glycoside hydrolase family 28 [Aretaon asperrimus]
MKQQSINILTTFTTLVLIQFATARDLRNVTEPKTPESCTTLKASGTIDTEAIQQALDSCAKGKAVALSSGTFVSGPLIIPSGVSLLVDSGVTLKASTDPALFDSGSNTCGTITDRRGRCKSFIPMSGVTGSGIYGKGTIDGQGDQKIKGKNVTWHELSYEALAANKNQNNPQLIRINNCVDITLHQITLRNSPLYHVVGYMTNGFTVWGITINTPQHTRNTDGVNPAGSQNVTIAHCNISTGDDNIAISALSGPARHISVLNNYFSYGSSMAIGSGTTHGVSDVLVSGLTLNNSRFGLFIKSDSKNGGLVSNVTYENVCIENSPKPITVDMYHVKGGNRTPESRDIFYNNIRVLTNGTFEFHGMSKDHRVEATLNNVHMAKNSKWTLLNSKVSGSWVDDASGTCGYTGNQ